MNNTHIALHSDIFEILSTFCEQNRLVFSKYIKHLIRDRPLAFFNTTDETLLRLDRNGVLIPSPKGNAEWRNHLSLKYLSYSEMLFSSLLLVSSPTPFINNCSRKNNGVGTSRSDHINGGYITGVVGPRLNYFDLMDGKFMIVTERSQVYFEEDSIEKIFYNYYFKDGLSWLNFKQINSLEPAVRSARYVKTTKIKNGYLDKAVYAKRLRLSMIPYILDANASALKVGKMAYLYVTGWGLGEWAEAAEQPDLFVAEFFKVLVNLDNDGLLTNISDVHFGWITNSIFDSCVKDLHKTNQNLVGRISFKNNNSDPASLQNFDPTFDTNRVLFYSVPMSGSSYPGNEYWRGYLDYSGNPAAASCSTVAEVQNPLINTKFTDRVEIYPVKKKN